jgi:NAD(P)-dependent dehydrogenase (short-subunit alcohol dehydrogenase family)
VALWETLMARRWSGPCRRCTPATGSKVDISNEAEITAAFGGAIAAHGKVDILVNSAGIIGDGVPVVDLAPGVGG